VGMRVCWGRKIVMGRKAVDISGKKFGRLTVLYRNKNFHSSSGYSARWWCLCDCGNIKSISYAHLRQGTKSCGCLRDENSSKRNKGKYIKSEIGNKYGRLTVMKQGPSINKRKATWYCKCECGKITLARGDTLREGKTLSCGCLHKEILEKNWFERKLKLKAGEKYGKWKILPASSIFINHFITAKDNNTFYLCKCDCGKINIIRGTELKRGLRTECKFCSYKTRYSNFHGFKSLENKHKSTKTGRYWRSTRRFYGRKLLKEEIRINELIGKNLNKDRLSLCLLPEQIYYMFFAYFLMIRLFKDEKKWLPYVRGWVESEG